LLQSSIQEPNNVKQKTSSRSKSSGWRLFKRNRTGMIGLFILLVMFFIAAAAQWIMPYDPLAQDVVNRAKGPSSAHLFGTDPFGRDILSRVILGSQTSLLVGSLSVFFSTLIGAAIGMVSAFKGGLLDDILMRILDSIMMIPMLLFGMMVLVALGSSMSTLIIVISIALIPNVARVARGTTLEIKEKEYIKAAISLGSGSLRIILRQIFPNILGPLLVITTLNMSTAIRVEASLSFIGVGVQPPTPTWGNMIQEGFQYIAATPGLVIYPGIFLIIVSIAFNLVGDVIRDAFDPHLKQQRK
jgi:peptide/nickel transport system permease protein